MEPNSNSTLRLRCNAVLRLSLEGDVNVSSGAPGRSIRQAGSELEEIAGEVRDRLQRLREVLVRER